MKINCVTWFDNKITTTTTTGPVKNKIIGYRIFQNLSPDITSHH